MAKNYYAILGVQRNATDQQIRERFKQVVRQRHPDRFRDAEKAEAESEFQELTQAFNILSNPARRREHDLDLARPDSARQGGIDNRQLARVYLQRGANAYRDKNYLQAADNFDRATKAEPDNALAWHNLALACSHQKRWLSRAVAAINQACELEPMNASYLRSAGRIHVRAGMTARAEGFYAEALKWGGDDPTIAAELERLRQGRSRTGRPGKAD